ncbi:MAG TPA: hypothetical protein VHW66_13555 [Stellaceae bacterium]|nr:hypothetical protein [Stellaceae bacterium]
MRHREFTRGIAAARARAAARGDKAAGPMVQHTVVRLRSVDSIAGGLGALLRLKP